MENVTANFIEASRMKLRFETPKAMISVEDLWDIPMTSRTVGVSLDDIAKGLNRKIKESEEESFVVKRSTKNKELELKFEIVKYIIGVRLNEIEQAKKVKENAQQREKILSLIADKEDEELKSKSKEELLAMLR